MKRLAILVAAFLIITGLCGCGARADHTAMQDPEREIIAFSGDGTPMYSGAEYALPESMTMLSSTDEPKYTTSGALQLQAELTPALVNSGFEWGVSFENPNSDWVIKKIGEGKAVTEFLELTVNQSDNSKATIKKLADFKERIQVTVTAPDYNKSYTCNIDCVLNLYPGQSLTYEGDFDTGVTVTKTLAGKAVDGNLKFSFPVYEALVFVPDTVKSALQELGFECKTKTDPSEIKIVNNIELSNYYPENTFTLTMPLSYGTFIEDFDTFTSEQKSAVYRAWYENVGNNYARMQISFNFAIGDYVTTRSGGIRFGLKLSGAYYGQN